jgi:hypothetical protein
MIQEIKKETQMYFTDNKATFKEVRNSSKTLIISQTDPLYDKFKEGVNDTDEGMFICTIIKQVIEITAHNDRLYISEFQKRGKLYTPSTHIITKSCVVDNFYIVKNAKQILKDLGNFSPLAVLNVANKLATIECDERSNYNINEETFERYMIESYNFRNKSFKLEGITQTVNTDMISALDRKNLFIKAIKQEALKLRLKFTKDTIFHKIKFIYILEVDFL